MASAAKNGDGGDGAIKECEGGNYSNSDRQLGLIRTTAVAEGITNEFIW